MFTENSCRNNLNLRMGKDQSIWKSIYPRARMAKEQQASREEQEARRRKPSFDSAQIHESVSNAELGEADLENSESVL
ncbi:hypothetical protein DMENIID0001_070910 [Sergentomyia squamirostris]